MGRSLGLAINIQDPLWISGGFNRHMTDAIEGYSDTISAFGGYWSATTSFKVDLDEGASWYQNGLGRHVIVTNEAGVPHWEGFVDKITVTFGSISLAVGPLMDIKNRVRTTYSPRELDENDEWVYGDTTTLSDSNNTNSQNRYSILPAVVNAGQVTDSDAAQYQAAYLAANAWPRTSKDVSLPSGDEMGVVSLDCLGYVHFLNYPCDISTTGEENADDKIKAVLGETPNSSWLSYNEARIEENTVQVGAIEDSNRIALNIIKGVVGRGGPAPDYTRWLFGVYEERRVKYAAMPVDITYLLTLIDPTYIKDRQGGVVMPWNVRAGRWLQIPDWLLGKSYPTDPTEDPRSAFLESVSYQAEWGVSFSGGRKDRLNQLIAQLGLSGASA